MSDVKSQVYNADCLAAMRKMPDNVFDLAVVDPPYGGGLTDNGGCKGWFTKYHQDEQETAGASKLRCHGGDRWNRYSMETLQAQMPRWISVDERLPEQYNPVLVAYVGYNTNAILADMVAYRDSDGDWCWYDGDHPSGEFCKVKITHWMPLPEPPKEVGEDG